MNEEAKEYILVCISLIVLDAPLIVSVFVQSIVVKLIGLIWILIGIIVIAESYFDNRILRKKVKKLKRQVKYY